MGSPVKPREWEKTLTVKCRLCGGAKCKRCSESAALAKTDSPVSGLHADWVADRMLGMMRPSSRLMKEYQIAQQFHKLRIVAVFNLTLPGEHPYCGDGLVPSGFPYDPEKDLMAEQIRFYNFGWEDMTTPTLSFMLDIAKVMAHVLQDGHHKLAVHCHAGYGRTGLAIACCLIFMHNIPPDRAIQIVRRDRPGSIQTSAQSKFVRQFHEYINVSRVVFALPTIHDRFSISETIEQQNRMAHGEKCTGSRLVVPCILDFLCREVEKAADQNATTVLQAFIFHILWQGHGKTTSESHAELQERHAKAVSGGEAASLCLDTRAPLLAESSSKAAAAVAASLQADGVVPPPPVPANLSHCASYHATQDDLFPVKVAFNVGEHNWAEAAKHLGHATVAFAPALLLDWLEHLSEPLLTTDIVSLVNAASSGDGPPSAKWKPLNHQPASVTKSLDRLLICVRYLLKKADATSASVSQQPALPTSSSLMDALCVRTAMGLFHLQASTPIATLCKYADFVQQLTKEWHPPKRLELNLESLQKMTKSSSLRRLQPHSPSFKNITASAPSLAVAVPSTAVEGGSPSVSPTRSGGSSSESVSLEPMVHVRMHLPSADAPLSPKQQLKEPSELSPTRHADNSASHPHPSPLHHHARPPVELPPMARDKEDREAEPSPVKMESLIPRIMSFDGKKHDHTETTTSSSTTANGSHAHSSHSEKEPPPPLIPTPPPPATAATEPEKPAPSHHGSPPPLNRGPGSGGNVYSLPSVKVGERYKNRQV